MSTGRADWWMPLHVSDYLRDTSRLTREQHGAYVLLLMDYWISGPPPDDDDQLAVIVKATPQEWRRLRTVMLHFFTIDSNKCWRQKRLDAEIERAYAVHQQRLTAARASATSRGKKRKVVKLRE